MEQDAIHGDTILELAPIGVTVIDVDGIVLDVNLRLCAMLGISAKDITGQRL